MACRKSKIKKMMNGTKSVSKYNTGVKQVVVPDVQMDDQAIKTQTLGGAFAGGSTGGQIGSAVGSAFGPIGGLIGQVGGGAIGAGIGAISANKKAKQNQAEELNRIDSLRKLNAEYRDLGIGDTQIDPKAQTFQSFENGTKAIEIEGKEAPEIHTDKNFNLKNLGTIPHSKGGNKVMAKKGDIVFDTQNSKSKYKSTMDDIRRVKLGDVTAKRRLEKEKQTLPEDMPSDSKMQAGGKITSPLTNNNEDWINRTNTNPLTFTGDNMDLSSAYTLTEGEVLQPKAATQYGESVQMPGDGVRSYGTEPYDINKVANDITGVTGTQGGLAPSIQDTPKLQSSDIITPKGVSRATSVGAESNNIMSPEDKATRQDRISNYANKAAGIGATVGKLAEPLYKYIKSKESISQPKEVPLQLERLKYSDTSDVDRAEVDASRKAIERQVNRSGLSRGQSLGRLAQTSVQAAKQKNAINQREQQIKQSIDQQNVNLSNQERQNLQGQQIRNQDVVRQAEAKKESYLGEAMSDFSKLGNLESQKLYMKNKDKKASEMDQKTLQYLTAEGYRINPDTDKLEYIGS